MSNSGGIITRPVNQRDVQQVLGISNSINKWSQLCTHIKIDKWSKYKPVALTLKGIMSQYDFTNECWKSDSTWWKNTGTTGSAGRFATLVGSCGLQYEVFTELGSKTAQQTFLNRLTQGDLPWQYNRPNGSTYPYRIADFILYDHNSEPVVGALDVGQDNIIYVSRDGQGTYATFSFEVPATDLDCLTLSDFSDGVNDLRDCYLGMVMWRGDYTIVVTSSSVIGDTGSADINVTLGYSDGIGSWNVLPFISSKRILRNASYETGRYLSAGLTEPYVVMLADSSGPAPTSLYSMDVYGEWGNSAKTVISFTVDVINRYSSAHTFHPDSQNRVIGVFVFRQLSSYPDPNTDDSHLEQVGSWFYTNANGLTIASDDFWSQSGTINISSYSSSYKYYLTAKPMSEPYNNSYEEIDEEPLLD